MGREVGGRFKAGGTYKKKKKVSSTVPFVSGWKPDTEETSKQKKL